MTVQEMVADSLLYERCDNRLKRFIDQLRKEKKEYERKLEEGQDSDLSFDYLIREMEKLRFQYQKKSNDLWEEARKKRVESPEKVQDLFNAVVKQAACDYESACCGNFSDPETMKSEILVFAKTEAKNYSNINFNHVLKKIDQAAPEFKKLVREHAKEIVEETNAKRKVRDFDFKANKYKCPLCGYGIFDTGSRFIKSDKTHCISCSGCGFRLFIDI